MEALSSSVSSTLKLTAPTTLRSTHHPKTPNLHTQNLNSSPRASLSATSRRNSFTHTTSLRRPSPPQTFQSRAATGYAAALIDIAQCNAALPQIERDVRRFSKLLGNFQLRKVLEDPETAAAEKGRVVAEVAEMGGFHKSVVGLVKMLVEKKRRVGLVVEVMEEFRRIYDELSRTSVVVVPSPERLETADLVGIARRVQMISGAAKVKLQNLVGPRYSYFAL